MRRRRCPQCHMLISPLRMEKDDTLEVTLRGSENPLPKFTANDTTIVLTCNKCGYYKLITGDDNDVVPSSIDRIFQLVLGRFNLWSKEKG